MHIPFLIGLFKHQSERKPPTCGNQIKEDLANFNILNTIYDYNTVFSMKNHFFFAWPDSGGGPIQGT